MTEVLFDGEVFNQDASPLHIQTLCCAEQKRSKIAHKNETRDSKLCFLKKMLGENAMHCNALNPFSRQLAIADNVRCLVRFEERDGEAQQSNIATLIQRLPALKLGSGAGGCVNLVTFCGRDFAVKIVATKHPREKVISNSRVMNYWLFESKMQMFLSRHMIGLICPTLARCPNFVTQYACEMTRYVPLIAKGRIVTKKFEQCYSRVDLIEYFDLGIPLSLKLNPTQPTCVFQSEEMSFSMIFQVLTAIVSMSAVGISHNDLCCRNVLARRVPEGSLSYLFPATGSGSNDDEKEKVLSVNTRGVLFSVADFGVASCNMWERSGGDVRFDEASRRYGRHGTLTEWYYDDDDAIKVPRRSLLLIDANNKPHHPLQAEIDTLERDIAGFFTDVVHECRKLVCATRIEMYSLAILTEFNVPRRLQSAEEILKIAKRVLSREFVELYFGSEMCDRFYDSQPPPHQHVYRLPTQYEGANLERQLVEYLDSSARPDCYLRLSTKQDI